MSRATRPRVRAVFRIGPWVPGFVLPAAVALLGIAGSLLVLQDVPLLAGVALSLVAALRIRTAAPWLLVALLAVAQLLRPAGDVGPELPALLLVLHLLAVLVLLARAVPARARLQLAALGPAAVTAGLVQLPTQALAALLLASAGRLQVLPAASTVGGALLVLVAGLLIVPRRADREDEPGPRSP
jgi:hypothetical protein